MRAFLSLFLLSIVPKVSCVNDVTNVVSHAFCFTSLSAEEKMGKKTLEEVHTYSELKDDFCASLPDSFSICSTIKT